MATAVNFDNVKKGVVSILQASATAYGTGTTGNAPDGSNRQFSSSTEINDRILQVDGEICTLIINAAGNPYQTPFIQTTAYSAGPKIDLPARNGMVLAVLCQTGYGLVFTSGAVDTVNNLVTYANHGLMNGMPVTLTTSGTLPSPLVAATTYYIVNLSSSTFGFASSYIDAALGTRLDLTAAGSGNNTVTPDFVSGTQAISKDVVMEAASNPNLFTTVKSGVSGMWFIEGNELYTTSVNAKVQYLDYTLGASPQAPEPYAMALIAGTVADVLKDGGDDAMSAYYRSYYENAKQMIMGGASMLPPLAAYKVFKS